MAKKSDFINRGSGYFTSEHLRIIWENPHILGWMAGYKDLTEVHSEWVKYIWYSGANNSLWAHRGSYKTSGVTVIGAVHNMLFYPDRTRMIVRKSHTEAVDTVADIAKIMRLPEIRELFNFAHGEFPEFTLERVGEGKIDFNFRKKASIAPSIIGMGSSSPLTGKHADFVLGDDISTLRDRLSRAEREYSKHVWRELITNVVNRTGNCCYIGTPWHPDGIESIIPPPLKFDHKKTGLITPEKLAELKTLTTPTLFSCNYELEFVADENALFKNPQYAPWDWNGCERPRGQLDAAFGGGDFNAFTVMSRRADGKLQAAGWVYKGVVGEWLPFIKQKVREYKIARVYVESNADKGWSDKELKNLGIPVTPYHEDTKKEHKIATYLWEIWPDLYFHEDDTDPMYLSQIVDWSYDGKSFDDAPDSIASLSRQYYSKKASMLNRWSW